MVIIKQLLISDGDLSVFGHESEYRITNVHLSEIKLSDVSDLYISQILIKSISNRHEASSSPKLRIHLKLKMLSIKKVL